MRMAKFPLVLVSILVLVEVAQEVAHTISRGDFVNRFNPCSSGSGSGSLSARSQPRLRLGVSILVLVEVAQEDERDIEADMEVITFQSLFQWKWLRKLLRRKGVQVRLIVSILVLVEVAQEGSSCCSSWIRAFCFNPCSSGSGSGRCAQSLDKAARERFQSLFQWKWLRKWVYFGALAAFYLGFNPCSSGSGSGRFDLVAQEEIIGMGFNPCSSGSGSGRCLGLTYLFVKLKFQSLFQWKWLRKGMVEPGFDEGISFQSLFQWKWLRKVSLYARANFPHWGFNPCSSGSGSGRMHLKYGRLMESMFQSLFQWKWLRKIIIHANRPLILSFQSLFQWKWLRKKHFITHQFLFRMVSILVLVEVAQEASRRRATPARPTGFNPCSSGSGSGSGIDAFAEEAIVMFQSLFQWKWLRKVSWKVCSRAKPSSFNPCSSGSGSGSPWWTLCITEVSRFNPCSSGSGSGSSKAYTNQSYITTFQSLFQWKWLRKRI